MTSKRRALPESAEQLLSELAGQEPKAKRRRRGSAAHREQDIAALAAADLVTRNGAALAVTPAGLAHLARRLHADGSSPIDPFRAQHLDLSRHRIDAIASTVLIDEKESPLGWLARRKGPDGRPYIEPVQLQAGERLRSDFTRAKLMPRTTANWSTPVTHDHARAGAPAAFADSVIAARQCLQRALDAVGPEFSGLLIDICCFLKGLADVERERGWPPRSAKVVLQLGLDRLARHYGLSGAACGRAHAPVRTWLAPDASFTVQD